MPRAWLDRFPWRHEEGELDSREEFIVARGNAAWLVECENYHGDEDGDVGTYIHCWYLWSRVDNKRYMLPNELEAAAIAIYKNTKLGQRESMGMLKGIIDNFVYDMPRGWVAEPVDGAEEAQWQTEIDEANAPKSEALNPKKVQSESVSSTPPALKAAEDELHSIKKEIAALNARVDVLERAKRQKSG